jgi:hypothetical protein
VLGECFNGSELWFARTLFQTLSFRTKTSHTSSQELLAPTYHAILMHGRSNCSHEFPEPILRFDSTGLRERIVTMLSCELMTRYPQLQLLEEPLSHKII